MPYSTTVQWQKNTARMTCQKTNFAVMQRNRLVVACEGGAGLNDGLFSETMDFRDFPSVLSAVRIAQS